MGSTDQTGRFGRTCSVALLLLLPAALAACGGSGTGSGAADGPDLPAGVVTGFRGKLSEVSNPVEVAPRYAKLEFTHVQEPTTSTGPNAPDSAFILDIDPQAGTVNGYALDFDDDSQAFDSDFIWENLGLSRYRAKMLIPGAASGYDYTSYGVWSHDITVCFIFTCGSEFYASVFAFGSPTGAAGMPTTGSATFNGTMDGYYSYQTQYAAAIHGDATLTADFGAKTVTGAFHDITATAILGSAPDVFPAIDINAQISGGTISGTVSGGMAGSQGTLAGDFFGPGAAEMGGVFQMTGYGDTVGAFAAKQ